MTGKQIEETLERNTKNIGGGFDSEVLNYINRLKAEIAGLTGALDATETDNRNLSANLEHICDALNAAEITIDIDGNVECENIRKETAEEILLPLREDISQCYGDYALDVVNSYIEKYGVEISDEQ